MGLVSGTEVKIINIAPMGDPISIDVRGYELGIRKDEAKYIEVVAGMVSGNCCYKRCNNR